MLRHMKGLLGIALALVVVSLITGSLVLGQTGTTSLRGTVTDKSGASVASAKVHLVNTEQGLERDADTGNSGEYEFLALPPGTYTLSVERDGFRKYERNKLQLQVNS